MFNNIKKDFSRVINTKHNYFRRILYAVTNYGFICISVYRYGKYLNTIRIPVLRQILIATYIILKFITEVLFGISIDVNSNIGPGFYIGHFGCIIIRGDLGEYCSLGQGVTIGSKGAGKSSGWPKIGNNVYIGAGAKIIGNITVGNNVVIGANAVVINDVGDNMIAVGVPAIIKPRKNNI